MQIEGTEIEIDSYTDITRNNKATFMIVLRCTLYTRMYENEILLYNSSLKKSTILKRFQLDWTHSWSI